MNFFSKIFKPRPESPFIEYPDGKLKSSFEALREGLRIYREKGKGRRAHISWQGQGSRPDSYHVVDALLDGEFLVFEKVSLDLKQACLSEGLAWENLLGKEAQCLDLSSLSVEEAARLLEAVFVKHLRMKPFEDLKDFCVGFEYSHKS